jgi:biotin transport system ATP-binding protein
MDIVEIEGLCHRFSDGVLGLDHIDLTVQDRHLVLLSGKNGSGKTLLVRHLNGLFKPSSGVVRIDGVPVEKDLLRARQMVGLLFQDSDSQFVGQTVGEDVAFGPTNLRLPREEIEKRVREALVSMDLLELANAPPHRLSGGEKRRLALAGVLAMKPRIIVFDEPFTNLDYPAVKEVLARIVELKARGTTVIVITHDLDRIAAHADRIVLMDAGRVVKQGTVAEILPKVERFGVREPPGWRPRGEELSWLR